MIDLDDPDLRERIAAEVRQRAREQARDDERLWPALLLGLCIWPAAAILVVLPAGWIGVADGPTAVLLSAGLAVAAAYWWLEHRRDRRRDAAIEFSRHASLGGLLDWLPMDSRTSPEAREAFALMQQHVRARDRQRLDRVRGDRHADERNRDGRPGPVDTPPPDPTPRNPSRRSGRS